MVIAHLSSTTTYLYAEHTHLKYTEDLTNLKKQKTNYRAPHVLHYQHSHFGFKFKVH
jgi:hypothetical protein